MREFFCGWKRKLGVVTLVMACVLMALYLTEQHPSQAALPPTAREIHLYRSPSAGITGDFYDLLKAKITEDEFLPFVKRLRLSPLGNIPDKLKGRFRGFQNSECPWWNPSDSMEGTFHDAAAKGSTVVLAKYEAGYVYFLQSYGY